MVKNRPQKRGESLWDRIVRIFGIRAVVGHTGVTVLEVDRIMLPLTDVDDSVLSCMAHNTIFSSLKSIFLNGLALGGDGMTSAVHSELSAFHRHDHRVQASSGAGKSDVVIVYNIGQTKPLLQIAASGVLATRKRIPSTFIERAWVQRDVPVILRDGRRLMQIAGTHSATGALWK